MINGSMCEVRFFSQSTTADIGAPPVQTAISFVAKAISAAPSGKVITRRCDTKLCALLHELPKEKATSSGLTALFR